MPDLDVVCVNYRSEQSLARLLAELASAAEPGDDVTTVVVDCSGMTERRARELSESSRAELFDPGENLGFASAANLGASKGTAPVILFINPDLVVRAEGLLEVFRLGRQEGAVAWTGTLRNPDGSVQRNSAPRPSLRQLSLEYLLGRETRLAPSSSRREVSVITGALVFVRRDAFEAVSGFDGLFALYMEDVDLSERLAGRGPLVQYPIEVGTHIGGQSSRQAPRQTWLLLHSTRVAFFRRRGPVSGFVARVVVVSGLALRWVVPARRGEIALRQLLRATAADFLLRDLLPPRDQLSC